jgi:O-antigen/teichoic acid export membrane protein
MSRLKTRLYSWLRWSERYSQTDNVYLAKGGFWILVGQIGSNLLSFVLVIFFANLLPKETYGSYRYILSLASIFSILTMSEMNIAVSQAVAAGNEGVLQPAVRYQLKWNLLMMVALLAVSSYYLANQHPQFAIAFAVLAIFSPLTAAFNTYGAYLGGKKEFRLNNIFSLITTAFYAGGMILVIKLTQNVTWLIVTYAFTNFIANASLYFFTLYLFKPQTTGASSVINYGRNLTLIELIGPLVSQLDKVLLNHFWGPAQLAIYSLATTIPDRISSSIKDWVAIVFPKLAARTPLEINQVFNKRILQGLGIGLVFSFAYIATSPYLFKYLLPKYLDTVGYSQVLAISIIFALPNRYLSTIFTAQKLTRVIFFNNILQSTLRLLLYIVLGIWGGIAGLVTAQVLNSSLSLFINISIWRWASKPLYTSN